MSSPRQLTKVDIYNTPTAREYRKANNRSGLGPLSPIPEPPYREAEIAALKKKDIEDYYFYTLLQAGHSVRSTAIKSSTWFGYKISENTVHGRIKTWRIAQARKIKRECGE